MIFGKSSRFFIRMLIIFTILTFGGMLLGVWVINEIIPNADAYEYANLAGASMFFFSFLVGIVVWQGTGIIPVLFWLLGKILTLGMSKLDPPTASEIPPGSWKLISSSIIVCALFGLLVILNNEGLPLGLTILDFSLAGLVWGILLNILANMGLLPYIDKY